jgi:hypothetical protein
MSTLRDGLAPRLQVLGLAALRWGSEAATAIAATLERDEGGGGDEAGAGGANDRVRQGRWCCPELRELMLSGGTQHQQQQRRRRRRRGARPCSVRVPTDAAAAAAAAAAVEAAGWAGGRARLVAGLVDPARAPPQLVRLALNGMGWDDEGARVLGEALTPAGGDGGQAPSLRVLELGDHRALVSVAVWPHLPDCSCRARLASLH